MQWMSTTSVVLCHALHAPHHAAVSSFGSLKQSNDLLRPSSRSRLHNWNRQIWICKFLFGVADL